MARHHNNMSSNLRALALLRRGPLVRVKGAWRFGTARVGDSVVDRLLASGRAARLWKDERGDCVMLSHLGAAKEIAR